MSGSGSLDSAKIPTAVVVGGTYNVVSPAPADGQSLALQQDANGNLLVNVAVGGGSGGTVKIEDTSGNALNSNGTGALNVAVVSGGGSNASVGTTGAAAPTSATEIGIIDGSGHLTGVSSTTPVPVSATSAANASGNPIFTESVSGSTTAVTQATAASLKSQSIILDGAGTNLGTVKAASTAAAATDTALVVAVSPNNTVTVVGAGAANATLVGNPVLMAGSDYGGTAAAQIPKVDATGLLWTNFQKINNAAVSTSASGTQKVGIVGGAAGVTLDAVLGATKPANVLQVGGNDGTNAYGIPLSTSGAAVKVIGTNADGQGVAPVSLLVSGYNSSGPGSTPIPILSDGSSGLTQFVAVGGYDGANSRLLGLGPVNGAAPPSVVWVTDAPSTAAQVAHTPKPISSTAQAVLKASPGNLYGMYLVNLATSTATTANLVMYIQFYNTTTTTGLSTANWLFSIPLPGNPINVNGSGQNPLSIPPGSHALANFSSGIVIVINTTSASNTTASGTAPVGVIWIE